MANNLEQVNENAMKGVKELDKLAEKTTGKNKSVVICLVILLVVLGILLYFMFN